MQVSSRFFNLTFSSAISMVFSDEGLDTTDAVAIADSEDIEELGVAFMRSFSMNFKRGGLNPS